MSESNRPVCERLATAWASVYTAGLPEPIGPTRRAEIASDLAEHRRRRAAEGRRSGWISREQITRLTRGVHSDLGWRRDMLFVVRPSSGPRREAVLTIATISSILVASFSLLFAAFIRGETALADQHYVLGGFHHYDDEVGSTVGVVILAAIGGGLLLATLARPMAPFSANVAATFLSGLWVMWFWLRIWPVALLAITASVADMLIRSPMFDPHIRSPADSDPATS